MSVDRTLHVKSGVSSARNVLKRAERIVLMTDNGNFDDETDSPIGLRKTRVKAVRRAGKKAAEKTEAPEAAEAADQAAADKSEQ